jgi:hypothetical protein
LDLPLSPQPFRSQKGGQRRQTLALFKNILVQLSGDDAVNLMTAFFQTREGKKLVIFHI